MTHPALPAPQSDLDRKLEERRAGTSRVGSSNSNSTGTPASTAPAANLRRLGALPLPMLRGWNVNSNGSAVEQNGTGAASSSDEDDGEDEYEEEGEEERDAARVAQKEGGGAPTKRPLALGVGGRFNPLKGWR